MSSLNAISADQLGNRITKEKDRGGTVGMASGMDRPSQYKSHPPALKL
jgi:hypothetical protein